MEVAIPRLTANSVFRVLIGGAQLGALYLATHAVGTAVGWKVMADAEPAEAKAEVEDEDEDDKDKAKKDKPKKDLEYAQRQPDSQLEKLTKYNVFCPTCAPAPEATPEGIGPEGPIVPDTEFPDATRTSLPLTLVATMEAEDPGISLATITRSDGGTGVYAEGEDLLDNVTLLSVKLGLVYIRNTSKVEYLPLSSGDVPPPPTKAPAEEKEEKPKKKSKYAIDGAEDAIKCTKNSNGSSCTVERQFVQKLMANPAALATQARPRPYDKYGVQGYQLSRIRKGSLPYMLGIRSGNVIKSINGHELKSLDGAMKLYTQLRSASHLSVDYVQGKKGKLYEKRLEIDII